MDPFPGHHLKAPQGIVLSLVCRLRSSLQKEDGTFAPAHILADSRLERQGRRGLHRRPSSASSPRSAHTRSAALLIIGAQPIHQAN